MIISYKKRLFAIFLAGIVLAFGFCSLSVKAFESTDDEKSDINENASWIHDYNYDHDHAVSMFSENSTVFNEIRNWVLSDEMNSYVTKVNEIDTRWSATSANKYDGNTIFDAFDTAFSTIGIQKIQALNEDFHFNIYNKTQSVVVFTLQFGISVSPEVSESGALPKDNVKTIEWVYNGSDEYGDYRYIDDYVEYLGDGWHLTMSGYDNIKPITTTAPTTPDATTTTTVITTEPNKLVFTPNSKFIEFLEETNREATVTQTDKGIRILVYNHSGDPTGHPIPPLKMTVPSGWQITYSIKAIDPSPQTVSEGIVNENNFIYYVLVEKTSDAVYTENEILDWYLSMDIGSESITTAPPIISTETTTTTVTTTITTEADTEQTTEPTAAPVTADITTTAVNDVPKSTTAPVTTDITTTETTVVTTQIPTISAVVSTTRFGIYESAYVHSLKSPPDKTVYEIGDELDLTGLKVNLEFYDQQGGHHTIYRDAYPLNNPDFIVDTSDFDSSKAGTYKIKVSCADKFTAFYLPSPVYFEVTVNDSSLATTTTSTSSTDITTTVTTTEVKPNTEQTTEPPTTDEGGSVTTETSTVPPTTTTGTETTLPQTGYSKWYQALIAAAMGMIGVGSTAVVRSGIFRKKENNS